ncbi:MAG TPA: aminopeptidase [Candidatus Binataceae bacterium]|nr:aminopeptidase [Candidatus Binataceae bacterium]
MTRSFARFAVAVLSAATILTASGCNLSYYARAAYEEGRLLWNRRPISAELSNSDLTPQIRSRLETVLAVREFAADRLGMKVGGAYSTITEIDQRAVVYVVMAAPRDSLTPYEWWYPIVGSVPYRGYFNEADARAEAAHMEDAGYDTLVRPAAAFSSLGFFDDPLLSNLLKLDPVVLAGVIFHELFHRTFFLASDAMFDESAATWVGSRAAIDFFASREGANSESARAARAVYESDLTFARFLLGAEAKLLKLYGSGVDRDQMVKDREELFVQIKRDYAQLKPSLSGLERFDLDREPLNNAVLVNYLIYFHDLDNFAALERQSGGNTRATIERIIEIARANPSDPFYAIWQATRPGQTSSAP